MKNIFLLTAFFLIALHAARSQSPNFNPLFWQTNKTSPTHQAQDRSEFPILRIDSIHCGFYAYQVPYQLTQEIFDSYQYDN